MDFFQHQHAIVESDHIGKGTRIWAFAHVLPGAVIGADCNICDHTFIENDVQLGGRHGKNLYIPGSWSGQGRMPMNSPQWPHLAEPDPETESRPEPIQHEDDSPMAYPEAFAWSDL